MRGVGEYAPPLRRGAGALYSRCRARRHLLPNPDPAVETFHVVGLCPGSGNIVTKIPGPVSNIYPHNGWGIRDARGIAVSTRCSVRRR